MYCSRCGKEIKEGNTFCINCGKPISNIKENTTKAEAEVEENTRTEVKEKDNSNKQVIKLKLWHIIIITLICLALLIGVVIIFNNKNNSERVSAVNDSIVQNIDTSNNTKYGLEIGKYYRYTSDREREYSSILFNNNTGFTMKSGVVDSQEIIETGTYQIEDNKITFTINYNNFLGDGEGISEEDGKIPYTKEMTILENGNIKYVTEYITYTYIKEGSNAENEIEESTINANLLEIIYAKHPELKDKEGYICTNGKEYWLLDKQGKKIYFDSLESFDNATQLIANSNYNKQSNEVVDRNTFLNNYITDNFKQILRENVLASQNKQVDDNFIEDRIEIESEQIIYTYIYVYKVPHMKPALDATIFIVVPNKQLPNNMDTLNSDFNSYFIIKKVGGASESFLDYSGVLSDDDINGKMPAVNKELSEEMDKIKNYKLSDNKKKDLGKKYFSYLAKIPTGYECDYTSSIASNHFSDVKYEYTQIVGSNKVLVVKSYSKYVSSASYKERDYSEYIAIGTCLTLNKLPFMPQLFTIQELIQTGYVSDDSKNCVITPVENSMDADGYSQQDAYIRKYFEL